MKKKLYRNDIILNIIIIFLCISAPICLSLLAMNQEKTVVINSVDGGSFEMSLDNDGLVEISGVTVVIKDGKARVTQSDCPDSLCVKMKYAENVGDSIICVPNKVSVRIVGSGVKKGADVIAG